MSDYNPLGGGRKIHWDPSEQLIEVVPPAKGIETNNCCKFFLFKAYYIIVELVNGNRGIESLITSIEAVLATGKLKDGTKLPPNVLEALRKGWEG